MPQLVHTRRLPRHSTLDNLNRARQIILPTNRIAHSLGLDLDQPDARIFGTAIVFAVLEVPEPGFEGGGIVFANFGAVGLDGGVAGDGGPFAGRVDEGEVDVGVCGEVVGLAGFGVGVEDEVEAVAFLFSSKQTWVSGGIVVEWCLFKKVVCTLAAKAMALLTRRPSPDFVVIMQNFVLSTKWVRSSTFSLRDGFCSFFWL